MLLTLRLIYGSIKVEIQTFFLGLRQIISRVWVHSAPLPKNSNSKTTMTTTSPGPAPAVPPASSGVTPVVAPVKSKNVQFDWKNVNRVAVMIGSWLVLWAFFVMTSYIITSRLSFIPNTPDNPVALELSCYIAVIGCVYFAYKQFGIYHIDVPSMKAWVTLNAYAFREKDKLRVCRQGFNFIFPWETLQPDLEVDLIKDQIKLTSEGEDGNHPTYMSKEKVKLTGKWFALIRPDPDNLDVYIQIKEEAIEEFFANKINQCVSDQCGATPVDDIRSNKKKISDVVAKIFDGDNQSKDEKAHGVRISDPVLSDIDLDPKDRDALAVLARTKEDVERAKEMVADSKADGGEGMTYKEALEHIRISKGLNTEVLVRGFENLTGSLMVGPGMIPGDTSKKGKDSKKEEAKK